MRVMIIGGTSGIGLALARHYIGQGAQVAICGRNPARVDPSLAAQLQLIRLDVTEREAVCRALHDFAAHDGIDLLIVTAGFYADPDTLSRRPEAGLQMVRTNILGVAHAFDAAADLMRPRGQGQLVAVASIAGLLREHSAISLYSITKRTVIDLCAAYRKALSPYGVSVSSIIPGYVDTARLRELNGGDARAKPFLCSEAQAVTHIVRAIERRAARHVFPWQLHALIQGFNCLPAFIRRWRKR